MSKQQQSQNQWYQYPPQQPYPYPVQQQGNPPKQGKKQKCQQHQAKKSQWEHFKELVAALALMAIGAILTYATMTGGTS